MSKKGNFQQNFDIRMKGGKKVLPAKPKTMIYNRGLDVEEEERKKKMKRSLVMVRVIVAGTNRDSPRLRQKDSSE